MQATGNKFTKHKVALCLYVMSSLGPTPVEQQEGSIKTRAPYFPDFVHKLCVGIKDAVDPSVETSHHTLDDVLDGIRKLSETDRKRTFGSDFVIAIVFFSKTMFSSSRFRVEGCCGCI